MRSLLLIAWKDATMMVRDRSAILIMLGMPLGLIFILGSALGGMESNPSIDARVAIVNLDAGGMGDLFVDGLSGSKEIAEIFQVEVREDAADVRRDVERGDLTAAVIIPADMTERLSRHEPVSLEVIQDPGAKVTAGVWAGVVRAAVASASSQIIAAETLSQVPGGAPGGMPGPLGVPEPFVRVAEVEAKIGTRVSMISYYAAGMTGMFMLFGSMFGAFGFIKERREQTLARMMSSPVGKASIVGGKALGIFLLGVAQFAVLLVGTTLIFRVDWGASIAATAGIGVAEAVAAAGLAMTLAGLSRTERAVGGIGPAVIMLFAATGGSMLPAEMLPAWLKPVQVISPVYWAVGGFLDLMKGAPASSAVMPVMAILTIAAALLAFGIWRVRYE